MYLYVNEAIWKPMMHRMNFIKGDNITVTDTDIVSLRRAMTHRMSEFRSFERFAIDTGNLTGAVENLGKVLV